MTDGTREPAAQQLEAARHADWQQVVLNGGPPCFHLNDGTDGYSRDGRFCLRAQRWTGHDEMHAFVSLETLLRDAAARLAPSVGTTPQPCAHLFATIHDDGTPERCQWCGMEAGAAALPATRPTPQEPLTAIAQQFYRDDGEGLSGRLFRCRVCEKGWQEGGLAAGPQHHSPCPVEALERAVAAAGCAPTGTVVKPSLMR